MKARRIRKTVRFDKSYVSILSFYAKELGLTFSDVVRIFSVVKANEIKQSGKKLDDFLGLNDNDRKLLSRILSMYSRSSTNINQSAHALNEIKNESWLDMDSDGLNKKLDSINANLISANHNFKQYKNLLDELIVDVRRREIY